MKKLLIALMFLTSCAANRRITNSTQRYKVMTVQKTKDGSLVTIAGLRGQFMLPCDTLKPNDTITITWINRTR